MSEVQEPKPAHWAPPALTEKYCVRFFAEDGTEVGWPLRIERIKQENDLYTFISEPWDAASLVYTTVQLWEGDKAKASICKPQYLGNSDRMFLTIEGNQLEIP